eukprot:m.88436 g.88436  ORF g.88436 m.88436 type:complete len:52 (+) comp12860_c0_seq2:3811-3966(+)
MQSNNKTKNKNVPPEKAFLVVGGEPTLARQIDNQFQTVAPHAHADTSRRGA